MIKLLSDKCFVELSKAKIQEKRNLIVSKNNIKGGYTLAQQLMVNEGAKSIGVFLKGAIHADSLESLYAIRDALNDAIAAEEKEEDYGPVKIL